MGTWVQLLTPYQHEKNGQVRNLNPGDWVEIGRQEALRMVREKRAITPEFQQLSKEVAEGSGALVRVTSPEHLDGVESFMRPMAISVTELKEGTLPYQAYERMALWDAVEFPNLDRYKLLTGLALLDNWEIAAPLFSYDTLAVHIGSAAEQKRTKDVIKDLRVPVYDTRLLFIKRCESTELLLNEWEKQRVASENLMHSFMRAFYVTKPLMLALPVTWTDPAYAQRVE